MFRNILRDNWGFGMKKIIFITTIIICVIFLSCTKKTVDVEPDIKPVKVSIVGNETKTIYIRNIGTVFSSDIKKLGFKIPGKIEHIGVKRGDRIKRGKLLARLETKELSLALDAAANTLKKAEDYYNETASFYNRVKGLYNMDALPQTDYDKAKLAMNIARSDMENARVDLQHKRNMLSDASLTSGIDGFVVEVLNKKGEIVPAGYPVVVIRNESLIVKTGVPVKELKDIKIGTKAKIDINGEFFNGKVTNIAQVPDERSRTYRVEVAILDEKKGSGLYLGSVAKVDFIAGEIKGVWVPVFALLSDGTDYVYIAKKEQALRKNVITGHVSGEFVLVEGLSKGDKVIVKGMKTINDGDRIKIK